MKYFVVILGLLFAPLAAQGIEYQWQNEKGQTVQLEQFKGKSVILHFWASWCPPCRTEMPKMNKWVQAHPDVQVVMISLDYSLEGAKDFYLKKHIQTSLNLGNQRETMALGVRGLPTTIVVDGEGNITQRHIGDLNWDEQKVSEMVLGWL